MNSRQGYDLTRITLIVLIIGVLLAGSLWTLLPFLGALIWAATIVVATWPLMLKVQRLVGGRRLMATAVMTGVMLAIFIVPFWLAIGVLLDGAAEGVELAKTFFAHGLPPPPMGGQMAPDPPVGRGSAQSARGLNPSGVPLSPNFVARSAVVRGRLRVVARSLD